MREEGVKRRAARGVEVAPGDLFYHRRDLRFAATGIGGRRVRRRKRERRREKERPCDAHRSGERAASGNATAVEDGLWQVELGSDVTAGLDAGSNRLEVVVVSKLVALPSLGSYEFVTAP